MSKSETNPNYEIRNLKLAGLKFSSLNFEFVSDFEIQISDFFTSPISYLLPPISYLLSRFSHGPENDIGGVGYPVTVALLSQEQLAMVGEIQLARVPRHQGEKMGQVAVGLGPKDAAQALSLFLARAKRPGDLDEH